MILILSTVLSLSEQKVFFDQSLKGLRVCIFPSPCYPLAPTPPIKIMFCAPSLWREYYSLLCDLESACLSPDWAAATEQLWKQCRSWGELWLVGELGNLGPARLVSHVSTQSAEPGYHLAGLSLGRPVPKLGLPITGAALVLWHLHFRKGVYSLILFPAPPWDHCINIELLGRPLASFHPGSRQVLSKQIQRSVPTAGVVHRTSSPLWPQVFLPEIPQLLPCAFDFLDVDIKASLQILLASNSSPCYCVHYSPECA